MQPDPARTTAHGFWTYARDYFLAAEIVRKAPGRKMPSPTLQLYGQSIELALKAFLLKRGTTLSQVKVLSHRLDETLSAARKRRLGTEVKLSSNDLALIRLLSLNYSIHRFRYIESGATRVPELTHIASICERLVLGLERYCTGMVWGINRDRG